MPLLRSIRSSDASVVFELSDGRRIAVPMAWFPRLASASKEARKAVFISPFGAHWFELGEHISVNGILFGRQDRLIERQTGHFLRARLADETDKLKRVANSGQ